jgi:hypothetical protein
MSTPVTRGELREELAQLEVRLEQKLEARFDHKLEIWGGALLARIQSSEQRMLARVDSSEQRMLARVDSSEQRMVAELARHTNAVYESMSRQFSVIDDKYAELPPRVSRLETAVFTPKRRKS